jgi:hypothetical protein
MGNIIPIILETTPHPLDGLSFLDVPQLDGGEYELRRPGQPGWWVGPRAFRLTPEEWRARVIIVTPPADFALNDQMKEFLARQWKNFLIAAGNLAGCRPLIRNGVAYFNLPA